MAKRAPRFRHRHPIGPYGRGALRAIAPEEVAKLHAAPRVRLL